MKNLKPGIVLLLCWAFQLSLAQEQTTENSTSYPVLKTENDVFEMGFLELRLLSPHAIGNHFLSQAYQQDNAGFELYFNIYKIYNFRVGLGHSRFGSSLTDASLAGNFSRLNYRSYFAQVSYAVFQSYSFEAGANLGYGVNFFRQRTRNKRRGSYTTGELRLGLYSRYQFTKNTGISFGGQFLTTQPNTKSAPQSEDLFGRTAVLYVYLGVYFNL